MNRDDYRPTPPAKVTAQNDGERWTLVFVRELRHAPEKVWNALTDPAEMKYWAPFDPDRNLGATGEASLFMAGGGEDETLPAQVRRAEAPRVLEYTWGPDLLRWDLEPTESGTRLTLRHTVEDKPWLPKVAAGWHICLDVLDLLLDGKQLGRIAGPDAKAEWEPLNAEYAKRLGVDDTGWPLAE